MLTLKFNIFSLFVHMPLLRHNAIYQYHQTGLSEQAVDDFTYLYYSTKLMVFVHTVRFKFDSRLYRITEEMCHCTYTTLKHQKRSAYSVLNHACVTIR